jgi:hypothetical protein
MGIFLFTTASRTALGPAQPPIQWVPGALSVEVKRPGCVADHSPPSSAEVKNEWSYNFTPQYAFIAWCSIKKSKGTALLLPFTCIYTYTYTCIYTCAYMYVYKYLVCAHYVYMRVYPKVSGLSHNEINNNYKHSLRSNIKGYGGKIH